jgi:hypothetical protein
MGQNMFQIGTKNTLKQLKKHNSKNLPNNLQSGFFVTENVSIILTLSSLPGTRKKTLEIFLVGLFEKNLRGVVCLKNFFCFQMLPTSPFIPGMYVF